MNHNFTATGRHKRDPFSQDIPTRTKDGSRVRAALFHAQADDAARNFPAIEKRINSTCPHCEGRDISTEWDSTDEKVLRCGSCNNQWTVLR